MRALQRIRWFLRPLRSGSGIHRGIDDEIRFHLEMEEQKLRSRGVSAEEARRLSRVRFGSLQSWREEMRDVDGIGWMESVSSDLRFGGRFLRRNPLFALVAVVTLALGIGASTAIFSVVDGILLRSLPFPEPQRLVSVWSDQTARGGPEREWLSYPDFHDLRQLRDSFEEVGAFGGWGPTLTGVGEAEQLQGSNVTSGLLGTVLGIQPMLGRAFTAADDQPGAPPVVLLSHGLWSRRFEGDRGILGSPISLDGMPFTVVGVLPPGFRQPFLPTAEIWTPFRWNETQHFGSRGDAFLRAIARLGTGTSLAAARADADLLAQQLQVDHRSSNESVGFAVYPLKGEMIANARAPLWVLLAAVVAMLLIVCVNLANLLLARGSVRHGELAMRSALGAGRPRILRQLLTESFLLAGLGGAIGVLVAFAGTRLLVGLAPPGTPRLAEVAVDQRVLAFGAAAALLSGALFGLLPALRASRVDLRAPISGLSRGRTSSGRLQPLLVVIQLAMALVLLIGAGLLIRSFRELTRVDLGYRPEGLISFFVTSPPSRYSDMEAVAAHYRAVEERLRALPGVEAVAGNSTMPLTGYDSDVDFRIEGRPVPEPGQGQVAWYRRVSSDYFATMEIPLVGGRAFDGRDSRDAAPVAIVNETLARRFFGDRSPLGRRITLGSANEPVWREIVGVAGDIKNFGLRADSRSAVYFPYDQLPTRGMFLVVRAASDPEALVPMVRREIAELDPSSAPNVATMKRLINTSLATDRFVTTLLTLFALIALQLAAVGLYGVVSYGVNRQLPEIGVRLAMGADGARVARWVLGQSLRVSALGVAIGLLGALFLTRLMSQLLFNVKPFDLWTFAGVALVMALVAVLASLIPARRAARVDPVTVLRAE